MYILINCYIKSHKIEEILELLKFTNLELSTLIDSFYKFEWQRS